MTVVINKTQLGIIFQHTDPCFLLELARDDPELGILITSEELRFKLAHNLGLPESDSLEKLCTFYKLTPDRLAQEASKIGDLRVLKSCLDKGADNPKAYINFSARYGNLEILYYLLSIYTDEDSLAAAKGGALQGQSLELVKELYGSSIVKNRRANADKLMAAINGGNLEIIQFLIDEGGAVPIKRHFYEALLSDNPRVEVLELLFKYNKYRDMEKLIRLSKQIRNNPRPYRSPTMNAKIGVYDEMVKFLEKQ